jgi:hypothetical protein
MSGELEPLVTSVVVPFIGEVVGLDQPDQVALALDAVRQVERDLDHARGMLEGALVVASERAAPRCTSAA